MWRQRLQYRARGRRQCAEWSSVQHLDSRTSPPEVPSHYTGSPAQACNMGQTTQVARAQVAHVAKGRSVRTRHAREQSLQCDSTEPHLPRQRGHATSRSQNEKPSRATPELRCGRVLHGLRRPQRSSKDSWRAARDRRCEGSQSTQDQKVASREAWLQRKDRCPAQAPTTTTVAHAMIESECVCSQSCETKIRRRGSVMHRLTSLDMARRCETWILNRSRSEPLMAHDNSRALTLDSWTQLLECHQQAVHSQPCISILSPSYHSQCVGCMYGWGVSVWCFWYRTQYHSRLHPRLRVKLLTGNHRHQPWLCSLCQHLRMSPPVSYIIRWRCGHLAERVGEAKNPGPQQGPEDPFWLVLENADGEPCNLRRSRVHSRSTWRWQAPPVKKHDPRRASVDRKGPRRNALRNWQSRWAATLNEPSRMTLEEACARPGPEPQPSQHTILPTIEEEDEGEIDEEMADLKEEGNIFRKPDHDMMAAIAGLPIHELLHGPVTTQKRLPAPSRMALHEALAQLILHAENAESNEGRHAALIMLILSPRLLWPEPPCPSGQKRQPYARQRLIRQKLQLLYQGNWMQLIHDSNKSLAQSRSPAGAGADAVSQASSKQGKTGAELEEAHRTGLTTLE